MYCMTEICFSTREGFIYDAFCRPLRRENALPFDSIKASRQVPIRRPCWFVLTTKNLVSDIASGSDVALMLQLYHFSPGLHSWTNRENYKPQTQGGCSEAGGWSERGHDPQRSQGYIFSKPHKVKSSTRSRHSIFTYPCPLPFDCSTKRFQPFTISRLHFFALWTTLHNVMQRQRLQHTVQESDEQDNDHPRARREVQLGARRMRPGFLYMVEE